MECFGHSGRNGTELTTLPESVIGCLFLKKWNQKSYYYKMKPLLSLLSKSRSIIALKILFQQASRFFLHFISTQISLYCYFSSSLLTTLCFLLFFVPLPLLSSFFVSVFLFFLTIFFRGYGFKSINRGVEMF
jgi:ABC-type polysaccharide/polyol phosphate export permease